MSEQVASWVNHPLLVLGSRLAAIAAVIIGALGTTIASVAVWIFLRAADNLDKVSDGMQSLMTKVAVHDTQIGTLNAETIALRKSVEQVRTRVYDIGR